MDSALYMCACCVELRTRVALYTVGLINRSLCACASDEDECFLARFVVVVVVAWYYINRFGFVEKKGTCVCACTCTHLLFDQRESWGAAQLDACARLAGSTHKPLSDRLHFAHAIADRVRCKTQIITHSQAYTIWRVTISRTRGY